MYDFVYIGLESGGRVLVMLRDIAALTPPREGDQRAVLHDSRGNAEVITNHDEVLFALTAAAQRERAFVQAVISAADALTPDRLGLKT